MQLNLNFDFNPHFTVYQNAQKVQLKYLVALFVHFKLKCKCKFKCNFNFRNLTTNEPGQGVHMHRTWIVFPLSSWLLATQKFPCAAAAAGGVDERRDGRSGASPMHYATEEANGRLRDQFVIVDPWLGARAGRTPSGRSERKTPPARSMILLGPNSGLDVPPSLSLSLCPLHCHYPCSPFLRNPTDLTPSWSCLGDAVPRLDGGPSRAMKFF